jgi:FAD/FMN-containing dehydrogenase
MSTTHTIPAAVLDRLRKAVGPKGWTSDPTDLEPHLKEWRGLYTGKTPILVSPANTQEVSDVVTICAETGTAIVPQGGNTGMCGGAVPNPNGSEIILSLVRMNKIRAIDPLNYTISVDAGCVLANIQTAAKDAGRLFPLSLGAEGSCQIGGNLSTNAGGVNVLKYGTARELALGLEVVLPDGRIWDGMRGLRKDTAGYDLKQIFIGAEGTLGIITGAVLKLFPLPTSRLTLFTAVRDPGAAVALLADLRERTGDRVSAFELIPRDALEMVLRHIPNTSDPLGKAHAWYALVEIASPDLEGPQDAGALFGRAFDSGLVLDAATASSEAQRAALWRLRESISEAERAEGASIKHDISVAVSDMPAFIVKARAAVEAVLPGIRVVAFGHIGDGNVHFNLCRPEGADGKAFLARWAEFNRIVHDVVIGFRGSISAEHGIGQLKRDELKHYKTEVEIDLMYALKTALDPKGIMNPGKVI